MLGSVLLSHNFYVLGFKSKGSVIVENHGTFDYEYDIVDGNSNGVSLYGFSEHELGVLVATFEVVHYNTSNGIVTESWS